MLPFMNKFFFLMGIKQPKILKSSDFNIVNENVDINNRMKPLISTLYINSLFICDFTYCFEI